MATIEEKRELRNDGITRPRFLSEVKKTTYYTPDGRTIKAVPSIRGFFNRQTGESGTRDANLDKGWLLQPPEVLKPYCPGCDKWHDTEEEVQACIKRKKEAADFWEKKAKKLRKEEFPDETDIRGEVDGLRSEMTEIKTLLHKILEK